MATDAPSSAHIFSTASLRVLLLSVQSFKAALSSPYVRDKLKRYIKPVLAVSIGVYFVGILLTVPLRLTARVVSILTLGSLNAGAANHVLHTWVSDAVALVPLVVMLMLRTVIRRPLYKTLVHSLREVNPQAAVTLEAAPRLRKPTKQNTAERVVRSSRNVGQLLITDLVIFAWHQLPIVGRAAGPVMQFISTAESLGVHRAAFLSLLALWGPLEYWCFQFVRLWRASRVLGEELLEEWVARTMPPSHRQAWFRANDLTITLFVAPQALLMQTPFVGPLVYVPMQFAAAWLLDLLLRQHPNPGQVATPGPLPHNAFQAAPTEPEPLLQTQYPLVDTSQQSPGTGPPQQGLIPPEQPSAPPYSAYSEHLSGSHCPAVQPSAPPSTGQLHQRAGMQAKVNTGPSQPVV